MPNSSSSITLTPINLHHPADYAALQHQRTVCGWDQTDEALLAWRAQQDAGLKSFFWIDIVPAPTSTSSSNSSVNNNSSNHQTPTAEPIHAGHISLDAYAHPPDRDLATADRTNLTIQSFFILPEHRQGGLGRRAMALVEARARRDPRCRYVTLNAVSKAYYADPVRRRWIERIRGEGGLPVAEWYERMGYVRWKTEPRYTDWTPEGEKVVIEADFMRKLVVGE
ncbi:hypothetical protein BO86DRAFT_395841 [Aspergillus japonicus CBS 114.51]|uniref:N-acetyltransferase domain-containing protein n=2 Tax=Aspergillus TaxID=5052 RepID=A0A2V5IR32_ASPV1|nr:hypothetical protein BO86DRAFT_395841 [Aspergillus japonicus CBS 114.51]PYI22356.1 hypothetical protein BO99DRAFT_400159 [Aspergillus violaceofuscus CBS 115571]RAH85540.1 hypothetical protein BO86DRAFT_395841 [Aspergillus japonicus CBS 114.51]